MSLDGRLLQCTEDFCHWFQVRTGRTNFFWARLATGAFAVGLIGPIPWVPADWREVAAALGLFAVVFLVAGVVQYRKVERYYLTGETAAHRQTLQWLSMWWYRIILLVEAVCFWGAVLKLSAWLVIPYAAGASFLLGAAYTRCVIPMPPGVYREYKRERQRQATLSRAIQIRVPTQ